MENVNPLHVDQSGSISRPKTQSPKAIQAQGQARESLARTVIGGVVLCLLTIAYIVALFQGIDGANNILVLLGSGIGFLLGRGERGIHSE